MTQKQFDRAAAYMRRCMQQSVHDVGHIERVLYAALRLAKSEPAANPEVVVLAALLHDIGRTAPDPDNQGHAAVGAAMAHRFLKQEGYSAKTAKHVRDCIDTHSYKRGKTPQSLEAKILFDADKLDLAGAVGTARALLFGAEIAEPFYLLGPNGLPTPGRENEEPSLYREYTRKLQHLSRRFYTKKGKKLAQKRQKAMDAWFAAFHREIDTGYEKGTRLLRRALKG